MNRVIYKLRYMIMSRNAILEPSSVPSFNLCIFKH